MITENQILDAINRVTSKVFPGRLTYREAAPEQFERPSLLLGHEPRELISRTGYLAEYREKFFIALAPELDDQYQADTDQLNDDLFRLTASFDASLPVEDRHLYIEKMSTERVDAGGSVDLTLRWFEYAPAIQQEEAPIAGEVDIAVTVPK